MREPGRSKPDARMTRPAKPAFLPWYKWFPRDFSGSEEAAGLSLAEEGAVRRLLDHQWTQGSIPADVEQLAQLCRVTQKEMEKLWKRVGRFFTSTADPARLHNARLAREYESAMQQKAVLSVAGQRGAEVRWGGHNAANGEGMTASYGSARRRKADTDADARGRKSLRGMGMIVFGELRKARVGTHAPSGMRYHIPPDYLEGLDAPTSRAIEGIGGAHVIASAEDDRLPFLRAQFADMYVAAAEVLAAANK